MGPMQALVALARERKIHPYIATVRATKKQALVAIDVEIDGHATYRKMPDDAEAQGFHRYSRTSTEVPRPFRDNASYTLEPGKNREAYAAAVGRMLARHPKTKGLLALHAFLQRKPKIPAWLKKLVDEDAIIFIPMYGSRPIFDLVAPDLEHGDPYVCAANGRRQIDVVTGERCVVPIMRPMRILGSGATTGTTIMSVDDDCAAWSGHAGKKQRHLRAPVGEATMNLHVLGYQWLLKKERSLHVYAPPDKEGSVRYFVWSHRAPALANALLAVLNGEAKLSDLDQIRLTEEASLCVLGILEGKRLQYCAWHCLPAQEALEHIQAYAHTRCRPSGTILGVGDVARSCVAVDHAMGTGHYNGKRHDEFAAKYCPPSYRMALIDHIVEGLPFPRALRDRVRAAYVSQRMTDDGPLWHLQNQDNLMEA